MRRIAADPSAIFNDEAVRNKITEIANSQAQQMFEKHRVQHLRKTMGEKFKSEAILLDANGQPALGLNGEVQFTKFGKALSARIEELIARKMPEDETLYQYAYTMARNDVPLQQPASPQNIQSQMYNFGNQALPQNPVNGIQQLFQQQQQAQNHYPGQAPARPGGHQIPGGMNIKGVLNSLLANHPNDMDMSYYMSQIGM